MTLSDDIKSACVSAVTALSESGWQWSKRTSKWDAAPAYGTAADLNVVATQYATSIEPGEDDETEYQSVSLRVADDGTSDMPQVGDKLTNAAGVDWIVKALLSAAYGSRRYLAESGERRTFGPQRGRVR